MTNSNLLEQILLAVNDLLLTLCPSDHLFLPRWQDFLHSDPFDNLFARQRISLACIGASVPCLCLAWCGRRIIAGFWALGSFSWFLFLISPLLCSLGLSFCSFFRLGFIVINSDLSQWCIFCIFCLDFYHYLFLFVPSNCDLVVLWLKQTCRSGSAAVTKPIVPVSYSDYNASVYKFI